MSRKPLIAGNWKMNLNHIEAVTLVQKLAWTLDDANFDFDKTEVAVFPPFTDIRSVQSLIEGDKFRIEYGGQDISAHDSGAYTGEISGSFLAKLNAAYVLVGHSERRTYHGETDEVCAAKVQAAYRHEITPVLCVGEGLDIREAGNHVTYTLEQLRGSISGLTAEQAKSLVIAYEPVWAIGTGKTATAEQAEEIHAFIRKCVADQFGAEAADATSILYGGSCKASNAPELFAKPNIDGGLIGGASLNAADFKGIIDAWKA